MQSCISDVCSKHAYQNVVDQEILFESFFWGAKLEGIEYENSDENCVKGHCYIEKIIVLDFA